jgi:acetyltransferase-like isoleucine patch superfamily enzyme
MFKIISWIIDKIADRTLLKLGNSDELAQRLVMRVNTTPMVFGGSWERVSIGINVKLVNALLNVSGGTITIGDHTFFGHNVCLLTGTHNISQRAEQRQLFPTEGRDIIIGEGVWIATNATIIGPCSIGDDAVIAAGAVVVDNIEAGWLYAGVPARKVKRLI